MKVSIVCLECIILGTKENSIARLMYVCIVNLFLSKNLMVTKSSATKLSKYQMKHLVSQRTFVLLKILLLFVHLNGHFKTYS